MTQHPTSLRAIMTQLRNPKGGCPWDLKQTHQSLAEHLKEEAAETLDALAAHQEGDAEKERHLREELGDLWLQIVFHAQLAAERGAWDIHDMEQDAVQKLVRRHPHIFASVSAADASEVVSNWKLIKQQEKIDLGQKVDDRLLEGIPKALCPLEEGMEIGRRCAKVGFEWPDIHGVLDKVKEEVAELQEEFAVGTPDPARVEEELGDVLFSLVQWARKMDLDPDRALRRQMVRFKERFSHVEDFATQNGGWEAQSLEGMEAVWQEAKKKAR